MNWWRRPATLPSAIIAHVWRAYIVRIFVLVFYLAFCRGFKYPTDEARHRQIAFGAVSLLLSLTDWFPYFLYSATWTPKAWILPEWVTPTVGAVSFLFHAAWAYTAVVDRPPFLSRVAGAMFPLVIFGCASIAHLLMNAGWLCYTFYPELKLPLAYEPVLEDADQDHVLLENEAPESTDASGGQLARLYHAQQSPDYSIERRSDREREHVDNPIPVSSRSRADINIVLLTQTFEDYSNDNSNKHSKSESRSRLLVHKAEAENLDRQPSFSRVNVHGPSYPSGSPISWS
ncbi:hypothetical protein FQN54_006617 [Arachnomyces sp. PD_36]|nr:hypothetical protein FQN54_006617 [Arachnomyces sp. PD_36]